MIIRRINLLVFVVGIVSLSCKEAVKETSFSLPGNAPYNIKEVHPASAIPGTKIVISGVNFPQKGLEVYFGDVLVDSLESISALSISVKVPRMENPGKVRLQLRSKSTDIYSNTLPFTVGDVLTDLPPVYFTTHKLYRGVISEKGLLEVDELLDIGYPRGLYVNQENDEIIYASYYGQVYQKIGSTKPKLLKVFPEGLECMLVDAKKEWMYLSTGSTISRMSMSDTSNIEVLYEGRQRPKSLHINEKTNQLIWCEIEPLYILSGSVDGKAKPEVIFDMKSGLAGPTCLEIDQDKQKIYVGDVASFGDSRILEGDLQSPGTLVARYKTGDGIGENIQHLEYDGKKYLYAMNSKGVSTNINEDGGIVRISLYEQGKKPEVVMQPINHGLLIGL